MMKKLLCPLLLCIITACAKSQAPIQPSVERKAYPDLLGFSFTPEQTIPAVQQTILTFSDMGAWHGHYLPDTQDSSTWGGFTGPLFVAQEYPVYLSKAFAILKVSSEEKAYDLSTFSAQFHSYPGILCQNYTSEDLSISKDLIFVSNRTSLVRSTLTNTSSQPLQLSLSLDGEIFNDKQDLSLVPIENGVEVQFLGQRQMWDYLTTKEHRFTLQTSFKSQTTVQGGLSYSLKQAHSMQIAPGASKTFYYTLSYTFTAEERESEFLKISNFLKTPEQYFGDNNTRWDGYLKKIKLQEPAELENLAVKALQTLMLNHRSVAGNILFDAFIPTASYKWFHGIWAHDAWKNAVALVPIDPELAKSTIRAIFAHQIQDNNTNRPFDKGMILDTIFYNKDNLRQGDGANWNERNSRPPLASWAVWSIYEKTQEKAFIKEMLPKLEAYHAWWYSNRDYDKNGIAEYGATIHPLNSSLSEIILAAAWESGMNNAPRFDMQRAPGAMTIWANEIFNQEGSLVGYTINQESVDLNSYLYAEKLFLAKMCEELELLPKAEKYTQEALNVKNYIQQNMFDPVSGAFYDLQIDMDRKKNLLIEVGLGAETYMPLWANLASDQQAESVKNVMLDVNIFNTFLPLGSLAKNSPFFDATGYWRGSIWFDLSYFGLIGLRNYGFQKEADELTNKIFTNAQGLLQNAAIYESYDPITGEALNAPGISWSASMILLMREELAKSTQASQTSTN